MKQVRCAIYTRKSSEEGLEQDFNSLDAQRESCAAYILSQAREGWVEVPDRYDDGGLSGGTLDRPALKRLLADVTDGRIDIIVVYKVDRLTRSLLDFSRLVEALDKAGTSFVSITQSFNTTTSMGRLTLNMLLSFAQFEREVTAERIRDKLAASKAKGMWMGGSPPMGYKPKGRTLEIVEEDAAIVRDIFRRYLELGNAWFVAKALARDGVLTPERVSMKGNAYGGRLFSRGHIYLILNNPLYVGLIKHKDRTYAGMHERIVDQDIWDETRRVMAENLQGGPRTRSPRVSLLAGKVVDGMGNRFVANHAKKGATRHRYYVSTVDGRSEMRIPAKQLEGAVIDRVSKALADPVAIAASCRVNLGSQDLRSLLANDRGAMEQDGKTIVELVREVQITRTSLEIRCSGQCIAVHLGLPMPTDDIDVVLTSGATLKRSGQMFKLVQQNGMPLSDTPNTALVRLVALGHRWWGELRTSGESIGDLAARLGVSRSYLTRVLRLAFLSPRVTEAIISGSAIAAIGCRVLTRAAGLDVISKPWSGQESALLATT
jgi:site-specific DNA recombinase